MKKGDKVIVLAGIYKGQTGRIKTVGRVIRVLGLNPNGAVFVSPENLKVIGGK